MYPSTKGQSEKNPLRPVLGSAVGGLRFELVLNKPPENGTLEELEIPFAILSATGYFSKTLLARIAMGEDTTVSYFALKIQRNDYPSRFFGSLFTNKKILKLWETERNNLSNFVKRGEEIVDLFDFGETTSIKKGQEIYQSKPITFCKRKRQYLYPVCPNCVSFLEDCRDDSLLAENGLPTFSTSTVRYLYCTTCAQKAKKSIFYTYSLAPEELQSTKANIRRRTELYRDFKQIIANKPEYSKNPEQDQFLSDAFLCYNCEFQNECYSLGDLETKTILAENRLVPVSYYECVLLPLELLQIQYDDFIDLLGGASWHEFQRSQINKGVSYAQQLIIDQIQPFFTSPYQFIFREDPRGLFALEILRLKLIAFTQLCRGIHAIHKKCFQPHLDIRPGSVMAKLSMAGRDLPSRWNFGMKVLDLGAALPFDQVDGDPSISKRIFYPPHNFQKIYTSPVIQSSQFGHEEKIDVKIISVKNVKDMKDTVHAEIEADLLSREIKADDYCEHDLIRINLYAPTKGLENVIIWASKHASGDHGFRILAKKVQLTRDGYSMLERCIGDIFFDNNVAFYKTFHVPCDVYSLGVMLLRSILVNDEQDLWQITDILNRMVFPLQNKQLNSAQEVEREFLSLLKNKSEALSQDSIFYRKEDREQQQNAITNDLWNRILIFALKLITNIKGFSFCAHHGDYDSKNPGVTMEKILLQLEVINSDVHAELFGSREENKEILEACDEVLRLLEKE